MDGFLPIDKPRGLTSHDVVARLRRSLGTKRIGHGGTLDPLATGLLVVAVGRATRLLPFVPLEPKLYEFEMLLGVATNTHDAEGEATETKDASSVRQEALDEALESFRGEIEQVPPMFSAVHHKGERLYHLARKGIEVERAARPITIHRLELLAFEGPTARILCECSGGTYVRTLAQDIGQALGVGAHMTALRRLQAGIFQVCGALAPDDVTKDVAAVSMRESLPHLTEVSPNPVALEKVRHGNEFRPSRPPESELVCVMDDDGEMLALARWHPPMLHPFLVLG